MTGVYLIVELVATVVIMVHYYNWLTWEHHNVNTSDPVKVIELVMHWCLLHGVGR